jgi:hypothetical protein
MHEDMLKISLNFHKGISAESYSRTLDYKLGGEIRIENFKKIFLHNNFVIKYPEFGNY